MPLSEDLELLPELAVVGASFSASAKSVMPFASAALITAGVSTTVESATDVTVIPASAAAFKVVIGRSSLEPTAA